MKVDIKIPAGGESITEVTIASIIKPSGSHVQQDEEILEIETDKVNQMVYASATGVVTWNVKEGDVQKVEAVIGSIDTDAKAPEGAPPPPKEEKKDAPPPSQPPAKEESSGGARVKEDAYLKELSAPQKEEAAPPPPAEKPQAAVGERGERRERMSRLRKIVAQKLVEVKNTTALLTTFNEVDMSAVKKVRAKEQENFQKKFGVRLGFMSFFVKASTTALQEFPRINAMIDKDEIVYRDYCDVGIAVGTDKGLMVPVLRNAEKMSYAEIEKKIKTFTEQARKGGMNPEDLQGGTFTISNGGVYGSLLSTPILNPPQSGILGMHSIVDRPIAIDGKVAIRPMMYLALSYDHRIVDGKESIEFLIHLKKNLEDPTRFILGL